MVTQAPSNAVDGPSPLYLHRAPEWRLMRAFSAGGRALRSVNYIPPPSDKWEDADKLRYANGAGVFNAVMATVDGLSGMVTVKEPTIDVPARMEALRADITGDGRDIDGLVSLMADEAMLVGSVALLVDYPENVEGLTRAQADALGSRPVVSVYPIETVLEVRHAKIGGKSVINRVRLREAREEPNGEWSNKLVQQVRVLELVDGVYQQRLFEKLDGGWMQVAEFQPRANGGTWDEIPFVMATADGATFVSPKPPLHELADINLTHIQSSALHRHCLREASQPFYFFRGLERPDGDIYIGSSRALFSSNENAGAEIVQASAESVGAIVADMEALERRMAVIGARFLSQEMPGQIAEATAMINRSGDTASLSSVSASIEQAATKVLRWCARFMGQNEADCRVSLSRDYMPKRLSAQELQSLVAAWQSGAITLADLYDNLVRGEIITKREGGAEEWQDELSEQMPALETPSVQPE